MNDQRPLISKTKNKELRLFLFLAKGKIQFPCRSTLALLSVLPSASAQWTSSHHLTAYKDGE
jgi:hypothetical protein